MSIYLQISRSFLFGRPTIGDLRHNFSLGGLIHMGSTDWGYVWGFVFQSLIPFLF
ncbi:hypothetical protein EMIT0158MI4_220099 [Burkholderia ambifaria]